MSAVMKFLLLISGFAVVVAQCPPGLNPLQSNGQPLTCSPQDICSCQKHRPGAACQYSQQHKQYICCVGQAQQCGPSSSPLISFTGQIVQCQSSNQCLGGFSCAQGTCCASGSNPACSSNQCMNGQVYVNGQCLNIVPIGSMCQATEQCRGGSICTNSRCECPYGTTNTNGECVQYGSGSDCQLGMVMVNGQCESLASPGMNCIAPEQCIDNSQCIRNTCTCNQGYRLINGYCIRDMGGPCQQTQTLINNQCVTYSIAGGPCLADAQCVGGATCQNSVCQCTYGYTAMYGFCIRDTTGSQCSNAEVLVNGQCMQKVTIGGPCMYSQQCLGNSICTSGYCQCPGGVQAFNGKCSSPECRQQNQVYINGQCYPMAIVGGPCMYDDQCTGYSQCMSGYCRCPNGATATNGMCNAQNAGCPSYQVSVNNQCLDRVSIGQSCSNNAQCIMNAICSTTCQCSYPYIYNGTACVTGIFYCNQGLVSIGGQCLRLVPLGQSCQYSAQCMGFGSCRSSICVCPNGYSAVNGVCRSSSESSGCNPNQVLVNNQCYPLVQTGGQCFYNQQCMGGSSCQSSICRCPPGTFDNGDGYCRNGGSSGSQLCASSMEEAVYQPNSVEPINCRYSSCPQNSYCYNNQQLQQYFCCRSRQQNGGGTGRCKNPSESVVYDNGRAINCLYSQCPANSHCEYSSGEQQYVCCR
uniref:Prion-like-(Q/N-rich) domain-bearing protein 25 n=1 Tax=Haemonchus contortus TaxID=6289 RepID=A0A7I4YDJ7_HAECO